MMVYTRPSLKSLIRGYIIILDSVLMWRSNSSYVTLVSSLAWRGIIRVVVLHAAEFCNNVGFSFCFCWVTVGACVCSDHRTFFDLNQRRHVEYLWFDLWYHYCAVWGVGMVLSM